MTSMIRALTVLLPAVAILMAGGESAAESSFGIPLIPRDIRYRIGPADVLEISFRLTPEFNQTLTVQPDGYITPQAVGEMKVSGMTVSEASEAIVKQYASILRNPVVTVSLKDFEKPSILVGGQVARPGKFELRGDVTLTDALTMAGGFAPGARESEVLVFRRISRATVEVKKIDVKRAFAEGKLDEDMLLRDGDSIFVSRSKVGKIDRFMAVTRLGLFFNPLNFR